MDLSAARYRTSERVDDAIMVLECLTTYHWEALRALAHAHVTGSLTYEGWRSASAAIIAAAAQRAASDD